MKKKLLFVLLALFCISLQAQDIVVAYLDFPYDESRRLLLKHKKSQQKVWRGERYTDFVRKFGAPNEQKEYKNECMSEAPMVRAKYGKNSFVFCKEAAYWRSKKIIDEGLYTYELNDGDFVLYDKIRGISIGVGDGEEALGKFAPNYKKGGGYDGVQIRFKNPGESNYADVEFYIFIGGNGKVNKIEYSLNDC